MKRVLPLCCLLLFSAQSAAQKPPPAPLVSLYAPPPAKSGITFEHRLDEQGYQVRFRLDLLLISPRPEDKQRPRRVYRFAAPERGAFGKPAIRAGLVHQVTAVEREGGLEVDLQHRAYRPPRPDQIETAPLSSDKLVALSDALIEGCFPRERSAALARAFRADLRAGRGRGVRDVLHAFCLAYEDKPQALKKHPRPVWQRLARLLALGEKGDLQRELYPAIRRAICGVELHGTFRPAADARPTTAAHVRLVGELGRAVLVGTLGGANRTDWWRLEQADPADPIVAPMLPPGVTWVRVLQPGLRGCWLRVHGKLEQPAEYRLEARNKRGKEYQWVEVHEPPPAGKKLPY